MCVCVCVCVCVCACMRACVRACMRVCVCAGGERIGTQVGEYDVLIANERLNSKWFTQSR